MKAWLKVGIFTPEILPELEGIGGAAFQEDRIE
jgi:hypothetical protein